MRAITPFRLETFTEPASRFHARDLLHDPTPRVVVCRSTTRELVLGSLQRYLAVNDGACERLGIDVTRRRSGGGAVLVEPDGLVWFDVVVPADDARFADVAGDVTASMRWLGGHVLTALTTVIDGTAATIRADELTVHTGPTNAAEWGRLVCFAGIAPGEVLAGGHKLVGISQRRTRAGSRFQCAIHTRWAPGTLVQLLAAPGLAAADLPAVASVTADVADALPRALVDVLDDL